MPRIHMSLVESLVGTYFLEFFSLLHYMCSSPHNSSYLRREDFSSSWGQPSSSWVSWNHQQGLQWTHSPQVQSIFQCCFQQGRWQRPHCWWWVDQKWAYLNFPWRTTQFDINQGYSRCSLPQMFCSLWQTVWTLSDCVQDYLGPLWEQSACDNHLHQCWQTRCEKLCQCRT